MRSILGAVVAIGALATRSGGQVSGPVGARVDSALTALAAAGFSGVVRVDVDGATILKKGYGLANRAERVPFSPASVVQIGSNTKDFTVVALLQLYERGRLGINDSIGRYFPNAPVDKRGITLWQLVTHRAGIPNTVGGDFEPIGRAELIDRAMQRPLIAPPGTREAYSNTGYSLLAAVIEQVSGTTYDVYVRENILKPLGLASTGLLLPAFDARRLAHGYQAGADQGTMVSRPHATDGSYWNLRGNGGMLSTVDDMHAFYTALFATDKLLKPATVRLRFNPGESTGLAGSDGVCSFMYARIPPRRIEFSLASNTSEWPERRVRDAITSALGLPAPGGQRAVATAPKADVHAPPAAAAATLKAFIAALNAGDGAGLRTFIAAHFDSSAGSPPLQVRVERMVGMHANLGALTLRTMDQVEPGMVELSLTSANEGPVTIKVQIDSAMPDRIKGIQVEVGG